MDSPRIAVVRAAYDCFNRRDIAGVLNLCHPDIELPDVLANSTLYGKVAIEQNWHQQLELVEHSVFPAEFVDMGDTIVVVARHEMYDRDGSPLGPGVMAVHRFTFRDDRIARMEYSGLDDVPEPVRARLG